MFTWWPLAARRSTSSRISAKPYLVSETIELTVDNTYLMTPGDSFIFRAYLTNSYRNVEMAKRGSSGPQIH
jgi:hypothetical protein